MKLKRGRLDDENSRLRRRAASARRNSFRNCKLMRAASLGKICASDRTVNAIDGMSALTHDFDVFTDARGAEYPTWRELEKEAGKYLR